MNSSITRSIIAALLSTVLQIAVAHAQAPAPPAPSDAVQSQPLLKAEELDQLVAQIALYPDTLLATIFMASTYPLEVVQADRWATENKALKADQLKAAVDKQSWDESVKSLVATPSVLTMMSAKLDWTQKLGDAVLAQQPDVMDAVQRLRAKAQANNKLASTKEQKVTVTQQQSKQVIIIEPTVPDTIYVPYYDPVVVYGGWPYPAYPPYYFPPPLGYVPGAVLATGVAFGAGYAVGRWASGGNYWGGGCNWGGNNINVNRTNNVNVSGNTWQHNSVHRQGVKYSNTNVQQKFGNTNVRAGSQDRMDFRGRGGDQVLKPGGGGANLGGDGPGNRPNVGDRTPGNRPDAGNRPDIGNRPDAGNRPSAGAKPDARPAAKGPAAGGAPKRDSAMANVQSGKVANAQAARGRESLGGGGGAAGQPAAAAEVEQLVLAPAVAEAPVRGRGRRWRARRWRRRRWTTLGYQRQARHRTARPARQRTWLLSLQLHRQRQGLCRRDGAGSPGRLARSGRARPGRIFAGFLRQARAEVRDLQALGCLGRADSIRHRDAPYATAKLVRSS